MVSSRTEASPARILVRETNWLGDVVMTLPALRAVRQAFPESRLSVLVRAELASFFDGSSWIDEVIPFHPPRGIDRLPGAFRIARDVRRGRFDLAVVFPGSFESALWVFLAGVPRRIGWVRDRRRALLTTAALPRPEVLATHQVNWHLALVREALDADGSVEDVSPDVHAPTREKVGEWLVSRRRQPGGKLVALAPGAAYGPAKEWPAARYAALVDRLAERHEAECVLVGAPGERRKCEEVASQTRAGALVAAGETTIGELVALLSFCDGFAGNDSGAMHVAGALGLSTVGIFGSTSPERTGPLGPRTRVLYHRIECSPCFDRTCRFGHYACFDPVTPDVVSAALAELGAFG